MKEFYSLIDQDYYRKTPRDRFERSVDRSTDCWWWTGTVQGNGYGAVHLGRRSDGTFRMVGAHRFSWAIANGRDPGNRMVLHSCDNPLCVKPGHLRLGTPGDNVADMVSRRRHADRRGANNTRSRLTDDDVLNIRAMLAADVPVAEIARAAGISRSHAYSICSGRRWPQPKAPR